MTRCQYSLTGLIVKYIFNKEVLFFTLTFALYKSFHSFITVNPFTKILNAHLQMSKEKYQKLTFVKYFFSCFVLYRVALKYDIPVLLFRTMPYPAYGIDK